MIPCWAAALWANGLAKTLSPDGLPAWDAGAGVAAYAGAAAGVGVGAAATGWAAGVAAPPASSAV